MSIFGINNLKRIRIALTFLIIILVCSLKRDTYAKITKEGDAEAFEYTGAMQSFTAPFSGLYRLEAYGAEGGPADTYFGGKGGYAGGYIELSAGQTIYIGVGGAGQGKSSIGDYQMQTADGVFPVSFNGVSSGRWGYRPNTSISSKPITIFSAGGGATHFSLTNSTFPNTNEANILIVAGGGGGAFLYYRYEDEDYYFDDSGFYTDRCSGGDSDGGSLTIYTYKGTSMNEYHDGHVGGGVYPASSFAGGGSYGAGAGLPSGKNGNYTGATGGYSSVRGVPSINYKGTVYSPSITGGVRTGNGAARVTFIKNAVAIQSVNVSTSGWTNKDVTLTINAVGASAYSIGGAYQSSPSFAISANGSYTVYAKDASGTVVSKVVNITNIDKAAPVVNSVSKLPEEWTNKPVKVTVNASDAGAGIYGYSFNAGGYSSINTITVNENAKISVSVLDKAGNVATAETIVSNIDIEAPVISAIKSSREGYGSDNVIIKVEASDSLSGILGYSFNGAAYSENDSFEVTENGTVAVSVMDRAGNVSTSKYVVSNIDKEAPEIRSFKANKLEWTKGSVTLTVSARDGISGLPTECYSFNGGEYGPSSAYVAYTNGRVSVSVRDVAGNVSTSEIYVDNIDTDAPVIKDIAYSVTDWTTDRVTITVDAFDSASGLNETAFSFDSGAYTKENSYTVSKNKTVKLSVRDRVGNVITREVKISNIDTESPKVVGVSQNVNGWTNKNVKVIVSAVDSESGLADKAFAFLNGSFFESNEFEVSENGIYRFSVRDKVGNVTTTSFNVSNIDKTAPTITEISKSSYDWIDGGLSISVNAVDSGSGIKGAAYSFDGGEFTADNTHFVTENKTVRITVRDAAGNEAYGSVTIDKIGQNPLTLLSDKIREEKEALERALQEERDRREAMAQASLNGAGKGQTATYPTEATSRPQSGTGYNYDKSPGNSKNDKAFVSYDNNLDEIENSSWFKKLLSEGLFVKKDQSEQTAEGDLEAEHEYEDSEALLIPVMDATLLEGEAYENEAAEAYDNLALDEEADRNQTEGAALEAATLNGVTLEEGIVLTESFNKENEDTGKEPKLQVASAGGGILKLGIVLAVLGLLFMSFFSYIYEYTDGHFKLIALLNVRNDGKKVILRISKGKLENHGKYYVYLSLWNKARLKNLPVYFEPAENMDLINVDEGRTFKY